MKRQKTPAPRRAGTSIEQKKAHLVRLMLEIASLDRDEYRRLRSELWQAAAAAHPQQPQETLRAWRDRAS